MLIVWSKAKVRSMKEVVGEVVAGFRVDHKVFPDMENLPPSNPGDVVLGMGVEALKPLQDLKLIPKNRTIGSLREEPLLLPSGAYLFLSYSPGLVQMDYSRLPDIQWDVALAIRYHETGSILPILGQYDRVESFHKTVEKVDRRFERTGKPVQVACDLETLGLDEYAPCARIISCSFTVDAGTAEVMYFEEGEAPTKPKGSGPFSSLDYWEGVWVQLHWLLTTSKAYVRGANFKYDSLWLNRQWGIACTNFKFDTVLVGSLLDENRSNSLKLHAKVFTSLGGYEAPMGEYDMGRLDRVPSDKIVTYNGADTDVTQRAGIVLRKQLLKDRKLANFYVKLLHPSVQVFEKMERNGICVDLPYYQKLQKDLTKEVKDLHQELIDFVPKALQDEYASNLKITSPALLRAFLFSPKGMNLEPQMFTEKTQQPSTSLDHLMMFSDNPDAKAFIDVMKRYGSATKTLSTYVVGFLKHLRSDGKFHPSYMLFRGEYGHKKTSEDSSGTVTGRSSAKDPAVQTVPKHTEWTLRLRRAFICPPGMVILEIDYSQGELRIAADQANEGTMIDAYAHDQDLHAITAAGLNGYKLEDFLALPEHVMDELRSGGKAGNFGLIYGMQAPGYKSYAKNTYGVTLTDQQAYDQREAFFQLYDRLPGWHTSAIAGARKYKSIRSPLGRIRHLPLIDSSNYTSRSKAERQAINSPIQATLSDMVQLAMVLIDREFGDSPIQMFLMTHDSLALYVPEDDALEWARRIKDIMENLPLAKDFGWKPKLRFPADAQLGIAGDDGVRSLATLKKLKNL